MPQPPHDPDPPPPDEDRTPDWAWGVLALAVVVAFFLFSAAYQNFSRANIERTGPAYAQGQPGQGSVAPVRGTAATSTPTATATRPVPKATKQIGDRVRDGRFEFKVDELDCSRTTLGDSVLSKTAQGKYCVVTLTVRNVGGEAQLFTGRNQKAFDVAGAAYSNDTTAEFYANTSNETFLNDINPGNKVTGKVVFDVPRSTVLETIELHDSYFSSGVRVTLR